MDEDNYGVYDRDIQENDELINEIAKEMEDLGITFEEISVKRRNQIKSEYNKIVDEKKGEQLLKEACLSQAMKEQDKLNNQVSNLK